MDRITNLLSSIPGYDGYRDKENRRETDRRIRERIGRQLGDIARQIESVAADLAAKREIEFVSEVDAAAKATRHVQDLVTTTGYGYGGLFSDRNVDEVALDQLNQFDADLLSRVTALEPIAARLKNGMASADRTAVLGEFSDALTALQSRFEERSFVIETGRPSAPSSSTSPLTVLEKESTKPLSPAPLGLQRGDALALGGANFIVDAVIAIEGDQPMRLLRIDVAPDRWLLANARFAADLKIAEFDESSGSVTVDGQTLTAHGSGSGGSIVTGLGGDSGKRAVTYRMYGGGSETGPVALTLDWATAQMQLTGHGLALDDIEVFGKPAKQ
jgi:hypothetical protein